MNQCTFHNSASMSSLDGRQELRQETSVIRSNLSDRDGPPNERSPEHRLLSSESLSRMPQSESISRLPLSESISLGQPESLKRAPTSSSDSLGRICVVGQDDAPSHMLLGGSQIKIVSPLER